MSEPVPFDRLREVFLAASRLAGAQRATYLEEACDGNAVMRAEVDQLLRAAAEPHAALQTASSEGDDGEPIAGRLPKRIADFAILGILGRGGMGIVYRARQERPDRTVALKVMRQEVVQGDLLRRFLRETQVQGTLRHPGIAAVFDAGMFASEFGDVPYFAMELIDGEPIDDFCRQNALGDRARCELVIAVGDAIQHAHESGVVHRDLKPQNVLVEHRDGKPVPRVLDFGIASCRGDDDATLATMTQTGQLFGTLPYMAPEQAEGGGDAIDGRCDVYALGVLLFELLTGELPRDMRDRPLTDALQALRDDRPRALRELRPDVARDLETVVATAIEADRDRRYPTVRAFADDLQRVLDGRAIVARPATIWDRAVKFVRRNRAVTAWAAIAFAVLLIGLVFVTSLTVANAGLADQQQQARLELRETLYGSQMTQAGGWWFDERATRQLRERVEGWGDPKAGEPELRGFEHQAAAAIVGMRAASSSMPHPCGSMQWTDHGLFVSCGGGLWQLDPLPLERRRQWLDYGARYGMQLRADGTSAVWHADGALMRSELGEQIRTSRVVDWPGGTLRSSADGRSVACCNESTGRVTLIDVERGVVTFESPAERPFAHDASWSADGRRVLLRARESDELELRSDSGQLLKPFDCRSWLVKRVALAPDGERFAAVRVDEKLVVVDVATGQQQLIQNGISDFVETMRWSPAGDRLVLSTEENLALVFDVDEGTSVELRGHETVLSRFAFSPDGRRIVAVASDGLHLWGLDDWRVRRIRQPVSGGGPAVRWSSNDELLLGRVGLGMLPYDARVGRANSQRMGSWSPDGAWCIVREADELRLYSRAGERHGSLPMARLVRWAPDSSSIALGEGSKVQLFGVDGGFAHQGDIDLSTPIGGHVYRPDGRWLAVRGYHGKLQLFDVATRDSVLLGVDVEGVSEMAWHPDGASIAVGYDSGDLAVLELPSGRERLRLSGLSGKPDSIAWHPHEPRLLACSPRGIRIWDTDLRHSVFGRDDFWCAASWSPDGNVLAVVPMDASAAWLFSTR